MVVDLLKDWDGKSDSWCPYQPYDINTGKYLGYRSGSSQTVWDIVETYDI